MSNLYPTISIYNEYYYKDAEGIIVDIERSSKFNPRLLSDNRNGDFNRIKAFVVQNYDRLQIDSPNHLKERKLSALECTICNLVEAHAKKTALQVSMDRSYYSAVKKSTPKHFSYKIIKTIINALFVAGYIHMSNGYFLKDDPSKSKMTRIWPSEKLLNALEIFPKPLAIQGLEKAAGMGDISIYNDSLSFEFIEEPRGQLIILKGKKKKLSGRGGRKTAEPVKYRATSDTAEMEYDVRKYNQLISNTRITMPYKEYCHEGANPFIDIIYHKEDTAREYITAIQSLRLRASDINVPCNTHKTYSAQDTTYSKIQYSNEYEHAQTTATDIVSYADIYAITQTFSYNYTYYKRLRANLYRVFNNGSFELGGRFYGAEYQRMNAVQRSRIKINDTPTVELDYKALHPSMLYNMNGISCKGDPYDLYNGNKHLRKAVKLMFNMAINAESEYKAHGAFNNNLFGFKSTEDHYLHMQDKWPIIVEMKRYNLKSQDLLKTIMKAHPLFEKYMCTGYGLTLQNKDSKIAAAILNHFTEKGIPCLCIHDSFIVKFNHADELEEIMKSTYSKHNNGFECIVDGNN